MFLHKTRSENEWAGADLQQRRELLPGWDPGMGKVSPPVILIHIKSECAKVTCVCTLRHWPREHENLKTEGDLSVWVNNVDSQWQDAGGEEGKLQVNTRGKTWWKALTDTSGLNPGPGEVWQAEAIGGALQ